MTRAAHRKTDMRALLPASARRGGRRARAVPFLRAAAAARASAKPAHDIDAGAKSAAGGSREEGGVYAG